MKSTSDLVNALQAGERQYKAFKEGVELAEVVISLENSKKELERSLPVLQGKVDKLKSDVGARELEANTILENAHIEANKVLELAKAEAVKVVETAKLSADNYMGESQSKVDKLESKSVQLESEISEKAERLSVLSEELAKAEAAKEKLLNALK